MSQSPGPANAKPKAGNRKVGVEQPERHRQTFERVGVEVLERDPGGFGGGIPGVGVLSRTPSAILQREPSSFTLSPSDLAPLAVERRPAAYRGWNLAAVPLRSPARAPDEREARLASSAPEELAWSQAKSAVVQRGNGEGTALGSRSGKQSEKAPLDPLDELDQLVDEMGAKRKAYAEACRAYQRRYRRLARALPVWASNASERGAIAGFGRFVGEFPTMIEVEVKRVASELAPEAAVVTGRLTGHEPPGLGEASEALAQIEGRVDFVTKLAAEAREHPGNVYDALSRAYELGAELSQWQVKTPVITWSRALRKLLGKGERSFGALKASAASRAKAPAVGEEPQAGKEGEGLPAGKKGKEPESGKEGEKPQAGKEPEASKEGKEPPAVGEGTKEQVGAPAGAPILAPLPLVEVATKLVASLEANRRAWLIDLQPSQLVKELDQIDRTVGELRSQQVQLGAAQLQAPSRLKDVEAYEKAVRAYDVDKKRRTPAGQEGYATKKTIEQRYALTGREAVRAELGKSRVADKQAQEMAGQIRALHRLRQEMQDRAIAYGLHLEETARSQGEEALFPLGSGVKRQLAWIDAYSRRYPQVRAQVRGYLEGAERSLKTAREVLSTEARYEYHTLTYQQLLKDYAALAKPGTTLNQSCKITFTFGEGVELGFFVQVSGSISTGDDRKIRPVLSFTVGAVAKVDLGLWEVAGQISLSFKMVQSYDGLHHFVAHFMRTLSLYQGSIRTYARLKGQLDKVAGDPQEYARKRDQVIGEARERGLIEKAQPVEVGVEAQKELAAFQAKPPISIKAGTVDLGVSAGPTDEAKGFASYLGGFSFTYSYTRKWFTRLVDYAAWVDQNQDASQELTRLQQVRADYFALLAEYDAMKAKVADAKASHRPVPAGAQDRLDELSRLKNVFETGHLTITRPGRERTLASLDERIEALRKQQAPPTHATQVGGGAVTDIRAVDPGKQKALRKVGTVHEAAIDGSFKVGGIGITFAAKFTKVYNDANPDNDGIYLNWSITGGTDITAEAVHPESDAGKKVLEQIAEAGNLKLDVVSPTASAVTAQFVANMSAVQQVGGVLAGGVKVEGNLVWKQGWFRTQYIRLTKSRSLDLGTKIKTGQGFNLGLSYSGGRTDFIGEWVGANTITYLQTVYSGMRVHPDWDREWWDWANEHRRDLWQLVLNIGTPHKPVAAEVREDLEGGRAIADRAYSEVDALRKKAILSEGASATPSLDMGVLKMVLDLLVASFEAEMKVRGSLKASDLAAKGWHEAEAHLDARVIQQFWLSGPATSGKPQVASKGRITRALKGATAPVEDLSRFGTFENLYEAGAELQLEFPTATVSPETVTVSIRANKDLESEIKGAADSMLKQIDSRGLYSNVLRFQGWHGSKIYEAYVKHEPLHAAAADTLRQVLSLPVPGKG
ncbi:MAG: hypothetical protein JXA09_07785 [Anaerolineae bacterium]|nr:hypothetical protein [Anaerolineae bacterium]